MTSTLYLAKVFYVLPAIRNIENEKGCEVMDEDSKTPKDFKTRGLEDSKVSADSRVLEQEDSGTLDPSEKLLLSIHEQCETLQRVIGMNYGIPHKDVSSEDNSGDNISIPYEGLTKEVLCLLSLLMVYIVKHYNPM